MPPIPHRRRPAASRARHGGIVLSVGVALCALAPAAAAQTDAPWPQVGQNAEHTGVADGPAPPYREAWSSDAPSNPIAGPVVADGTVVVVGGASVVALDAATGEVVWESARREGSAGPALIVDGLVVYSEGKGDPASLAARSLENGRFAWRANTDGAVVGGAASVDDLVIVATRAGTVLALDAETGEEDWELEIGGRVDSSPAVIEETVLVVADRIGEGTSTVIALDAASGEERWRFAPEGVSIGSSSIAVADGVAYLGMGDGRIHAVDLATGAERWSMPAFAGRQGFRARQVPAVPGDVLATDIIVLSLLDAASGEERWTYRLNDLLETSSPAVVGSWAVFGDASGLAAVVDLASGRLVWERQIGPGPIGAPASDGERVYLASRAADGEAGAVVALEHDPEGTLLDEPSPTALFPLTALGNYALAFVLVGAAVLLLFRYVVPERREEPGPDPEEES